MSVVSEDTNQADLGGMRKSKLLKSVFKITVYPPLAVSAKVLPSPAHLLVSREIQLYDKDMKPFKTLRRHQVHFANLLCKLSEEKCHMHLLDNV